MCDPPCENGGRCVAPGVCSCGLEWERPRCEQGKLNNCLLSNFFSIENISAAVCHPPCQNNGQCARSNQCACTEEWEGDICNERKCLYMPTNGITVFTCHVGNIRRTVVQRTTHRIHSCLPLNKRSCLGQCTCLHFDKELCKLLKKRHEMYTCKLMH